MKESYLHIGSARPSQDFSSLNWAMGMGTSIQHSYFLTCLCQYFLLIVTLVLSSLLTSKDRWLAHCETNFSILDHYLFFVRDCSKILSFITIFSQASLTNLKNITVLTSTVILLLCFCLSHLFLLEEGNLRFTVICSLWLSWERPHFRRLEGLHCYIYS